MNAPKSAILLLLIALAVIWPANAQQVRIPNFWDTNERFQKPELANLPRLRFLTTTDFPPFNFIDRQKNLTGFHVDLARAICIELTMLNRCQIQALPWDELETALDEGRGDAIIAGLTVTAERRKKFNFSRPYLKIPARFVVRSESDMAPPAYTALFKKMTGVVAGSAHEAFFSSAFGERKFKSFESKDAALTALRAGEIDSVFSDALSLSFWLASSKSSDCCMFLDGPFLSERHFGHGLAITLPRNRAEVQDGINYALSKVNEKGVFAELYLRYFPLGLY